MVFIGNVCIVVVGPVNHVVVMRTMWLAWEPCGWRGNHVVVMRTMWLS